MAGVFVAGKKFGIWPFSIRHVKMTIVGFAAALAGYLIPQLPLVADIVIRSLLVTVLFTSGMYVWKLSEELNNLAGSVMDRFRKRS
jgi:hypothetical protein